MTTLNLYITTIDSNNDTESFDYQVTQDELESYGGIDWLLSEVIGDNSKYILHLEILDNGDVIKEYDVYDDFVCDLYNVNNQIRNFLNTIDY